MERRRVAELLRPRSRLRSPIRVGPKVTWTRLVWHFGEKLRPDIDSISVGGPPCARVSTSKTDSCV